MKERPIPFSAPMVRPLLAGTKTQTRRVVKPQPPTGWGRNCWFSAPVWGWTAQAEPAQTWHKVRCPYGQPGDRLWVREAWRAPAEFDRVKPSDLRAPGDGLLGTPIIYEASRHESVQFGKLRPGMFMPRWASRITLEVTAVRVERLQDISEADAIAEGTPGGHGAIAGYSYNATPGEHYRALWESINGPGSWDANPWVWVVKFRRLA